MPSQFIRIACYGVNARADRKRHENAFDILAEADRQPGSAPHIRNPQSPALLHGEPIGKLENTLTDFVAVASCVDLDHLVRERRDCSMAVLQTLSLELVIRRSASAP